MPGYAVTTLSILRARVLERLISPFWGSAEVTAYINEALRIWNTLTGYQKNSSSFSLSQAFVAYPLSTVSASAMVLLRIETGVTHIGTMQLSSINNFDQTWVTVKNPGQIPAYFPTNVSQFPSPSNLRTFPVKPITFVAQTSTVVPVGWFHLGLNSFVLYPITKAFSGTAYFIEQFTPLLNDTDFVQLGEEDLAAIIDFVTFIAHLKEGGAELQNSANLMKNFLEQAAKYNSKILKSSLYARVLGAAFQEQERPQELKQETAR